MCKKIYFALFNLFLLVNASAQTTQTIKGKILDETGAALPYARIIDQNSKITTLSNQRGIFHVSSKNQPISLKISYLGYETLDTTFTLENNSSDTIFCVFKLKPSVNELSTITVSSKPYHQVYQTTNLNILDYTFFGQNILLLVNYKNEYQIRLMDQSEKLLTRQQLQFKPQGFVKDCLGILHIFSKDTLYPVHFNSEFFSFPDAIPIEDYIEFIEPCVTSTDDFFALQYRTDFNQTIQYISQRKIDDSYGMIRLITDIDQVEYVLDYAEELNLTFAPSMVGEIYLQSDIRAAREKFQDQVFFDLVVTKAVYAPLFKTSNALFVFDHLADSCFVFNHQCQPIRQFQLSYHLQPEWANKLILEEGNERIFTVHQVNGIFSISEINLETGILKSKVTLEEHTYPEKIKIRNGWIYYLHHDPINSGFNKLFRVPINRY
jgi:hypothetical protein